MLVPISWLKEYVDVKLPLKDLMWRMTEVGMTTESFKREGEDVILDVEVTPNRPDWMSIVGIAREVAAIQGTKLKLPQIAVVPRAKKSLPVKFKLNYKLIERWSAIVLSDITLKPSPKFIQERLKLVGLRPINNIVDITNYVMFELGIPMHAFDYDEIKGHLMSLELAKEGETFTSVDELTYKLPKDTMIIRDAERVIDLVGIKGGLNSGINENTKNILLHATIDNPQLIRHTSQKLGLRSEASSIYERGPDKGGTVSSLLRATNLMAEYAGALSASEIFDFKEKNFGPSKLELNLGKLTKILGISIPEKEVLEILERLNLSPKVKGKTVTCDIPTYRGDLKIEEDLIEEVARLYGYNNFPKTLPKGVVSSVKAPYYYDRDFESDLKNLMIGCGYSEAVTLSLISSNLIDKSQLTFDAHIKIANPVSNEYEYMRTTLVPNLLTAVKMNSLDSGLKIFEYGKVYLDFPENTKELYKLGVIEKNTSFRSLKGTLDFIFERLGIKDFEIRESVFDKGLWHPIKSGVIELKNKFLGTFGEIHPKVLSNFSVKDEVFAFELDVANLKELRKDASVADIPKYPPQVEDITLTLPSRTRVGEIIGYIKSNFKLISLIELKDIYKDAYTFRVWYQKKADTMTDEEVQEIRKEMLKSLKKEFRITQKV